MSGNTWKVYKWTSSTSGKSYIGITRHSIYRRAGLNMKHYKHSTAFWQAICKYGYDDFNVEILHKGLVKTDAIRLEIKAIKHHNTLSPNGYNLTTGGDAPEWSDESRQKVSRVKKNQSAETRKKISDAIRGRKFPAISESQKGFKNHRRRKRLKAEWMYILSVAQVYYVTHDYRMKREAELFDDKPVYTCAEQLDMFTGQN